MPNTNMTITTRFAPSPTGFLHIGGARTALFNWLFAQHNGGQFLLRVEDTDTKRSTAAAISEIIEGLKWLGLAWNGDIVYQSKNRTKHREVANKLLENGLAYKCFSTPEELSEMRLRAREEGKQPRYDGRWRDKGPDDWPSDILPCIRFKSPGDGVSLIQDEVQGEIQIKNSQLDDMVLMRSDGTPTYILAAVVDDHNMGVTHIIRGDDHLVNAVRQSHLYKAMNWVEPIYAHIPLIHGADGSKLSKRHGALAVSAYEEMGFLSEALQNYLMRLGWSHGDDEIISLSQAINWFTLKNVGKGAARFDLSKLESLNAHYIQNLSLARAVDIMSAGLTQNLGRPLGSHEKERLTLGAPGLLLRAKTTTDLIKSAKFYVVNRPIPLDGKACKVLETSATEILPKIAAALRDLADWETDEIETQMRSLADRHGLKLGSVAQPLRAALTGTTVSPSIFEVMKALGRAESLARLSDV